MNRKTKSLLALLLCITLTLGLSMNVAATEVPTDDAAATEDTQAAEEQTTEDAQPVEEQTTEGTQTEENQTTENDSVSLSTESIEALQTELDTLQENDAIVDNQLIVVAKDDEAFQETVEESPEDTLIDVTDTNEDTITTVETTEDLATKMAEFEADPNVEYVQPNFKYTLQDDDITSLASTDDPRSSEQWYLSGNVLVKDAWDTSKTEKKVKVAVIDSGIEASHPDLKANISSKSYDFVYDTASMTDSNGHGTHVAGIIAAVANNGVGIAGVSYNAELLSYRVTWKNADGDEATNSSILLKAYDRAVNDGAKVINMSLGGYQSDDNMDVLLLSAITSAEDEGIVTVCAGGNGSTTAKSYPADYDPCISVTATDSNNKIADFSDHNEYKDIAAPGVDILSTYINGGYATLEGTSMASPVVAGVASLMFAADSTLTVEKVKDYLYSTATDFGTTGRDDYYGNGLVNAKAAVEKALDPNATPTKSTRVYYETHVQDIGWQASVRDGQLAGTTGQSKRLEAIKITLADQSVTGEIQYRTHVQDYGWRGWSQNGAVSGTTGESKRLEAIQIKLTGDLADKYDIYYRAHAQEFGWLDWAKNGDSAGTAGYSYRLEAIQIQLVEKGGSAPGYTDYSYFEPQISYQTHIQNIGWQELKYDGAISGTSGQSKRLEGIKIKLTNAEYTGNIQYKTHVQDSGWEKNWVQNGNLSGTTGKSKRLEAIQIQLTGEMAKHYDVYYRTHCQNYGWLGWAMNGEMAGTSGYSLRMEAIEIVLAPKNDTSLSSTISPYQVK